MSTPSEQADPASQSNWKDISTSHALSPLLVLDIQSR